MTRIPLPYVTRSLLQRKGSTALTVGSFALVVLVMIALLSMVRGIDQSLIGSGSPDRFFVISKTATTENQSRLAQEDAQAIGVYAGVKVDAQANPITSHELVSTTYAAGPSGDQVQINFRGIDQHDALAVHTEFKLVEGRFFNPSAEDEVIVGLGALASLGVAPGGTFTCQRQVWRVVGVFEDDGSPFESEVWTSRTNVQLAFSKNYVSSVWALVKDPMLTEPIVSQLNTDQSLSVYATTELDYFAQGAGSAQGLRALAWFVAVIMSIGAIFSAINTMYASVSDRARELATMRAIGFTPASVLRATVLESVILAAAGGIVAIALAFFLNGLTFRTIVPGVGFVSFQFAVTADLLVTGILFALVMGVVGGYIPARHAIRIPIIDALKS